MLSLIIPVLNPGAFAGQLARAIGGQRVRPDEIIVLDSESNDGSVSAFEAIGAQIHRVPRRTFDHGGTRRYGMEIARGDDLLYLTQDAIPADPHAFDRLAAALHSAPDIAIAYGRHQPRAGANAFGAHLRLFAYPEVSHVRSAADVPRVGLRTAFASNTFAMYRRSALEDVGGFAPRIVSNEDLHAAARMLLRGWRVSYAAEAIVEHSHDSSAIAEARQFFDTGVMHAEERWLLSTLGVPEGSAAEFARSEYAYLRARREPWALPRWGYRNAVRLIAYRLGRAHHVLPTSVKRRLTAQPAYWAQQ
jgi:rhamnosyltransferase